MRGAGRGGEGGHPLASVVGDVASSSSSELRVDVFYRRVGAAPQPWNAVVFLAQPFSGGDCRGIRIVGVRAV